MQPLDILFLVLRWLHITSSIILVGGAMYYRFAVLPAIEALPEGQRDSLSAALRHNWAMLVRIAIARSCNPIRKTSSDFSIR